MDATVQHDLTAWRAAFDQYTQYCKQQPQVALERKAMRLGYALWKGFSAHQFGGTPRRSGIAWAELERRTSAHQGTKVRAGLMAKYLAIKAALVGTARRLRSTEKNFGGTLDQWSSLQNSTKANQEARINAWQETVGREIREREHGIGMLAASFLWYRYRGEGDKRTLVKNRRGGTLGSFEIAEGIGLITGNAAGLNVVDARYGIVDAAIRDETDDTMKYVRRKIEEKAAETLRNTLK